MADTYAASQIAKWFIDWANSEDAPLTNLKLQKLLYYAQGHFLASHKRPLFDESIQAWSHGPVVPAVYRDYKSFGADAIELESEDPFEWDDIDRDTTAFLGKVWNTYGGLAAWKLRNMTHAERPWRDHFEAGQRFIEIPQADIAEYFASRGRGE